MPLHSSPVNNRSSVCVRNGPSSSPARFNDSRAITVFFRRCFLLGDDQVFLVVVSGRRRSVRDISHEERVS